MTTFAVLVALDGARVTELDVAPLAAALGAPRERQRFLLLEESVALVLVDPPGANPAAPPREIARVPRGGWLVLDGRLDDRRGFAARAGLASEVERFATDAELLAAALATLGESALDFIVGPFAMLLVAPRVQQVLLARDPLGGRTLFLRRSGDRLAVASRPSALLRVGTTAVAPDEGSLARFLALHGPRPGATYFRGIEEIQPGALVRFDDTGRLDGRAADLLPALLRGARRDRDYEERFRELLGAAVGARTTEPLGAAVLMSGGLDSTAVAAVAAERSRAGDHGPLTTVSWLFPTIYESDETPWIEAANRHLGADSVTFAGDELLPLVEGSPAQHSLDAPTSEIYWPLIDRIVAIAKERGFDSLLTGGAGDLLWGGGRDWLRDSLLGGRLLSAAGGLVRGAIYGARRRPLAHPLWNSAGRLLRSDPWRPREPRERPWLTRLGQGLYLDECDRAGGERPWSALRVRVEKIVASRDLDLMSNLNRALGERGIEFRRPFRDRRLVEFFLGLPADQLYRPGETKRLLRRALAGRLPPLVLERQQPTPMHPLVRRGFEGPAWPELREALADPDAIWHRYVDRDWLWNRVTPGRNLAFEGPGHVVAWQCFCLERWRRSLAARRDPTGETLDRSGADALSPR